MPTKKNILILLISLVFFAPMLTHIFSIITIYTLKQNLERFENKQQVQLVLLTKTIQWNNKGKELEVGDRMFDVKKQYKKGDSTVLIGWYDDEEDFAKEKQYIANRKDSKEKRQIHIPFFTYSFFEKPLSFSLKKIYKIKKVYPNYKCTFQEIIHTYLGPPPKAFVFG